MKGKQFSRVFTFVIIFMTLLAVLGLPNGKAFAATRTVCASGCDHTTIAAAVTAATAGDTIQILAGTYTAPTIAVNKSLTFQGVGTVIIRTGNTAQHAFNVTASNVTFDNLTIRDSFDGIYIGTGTISGITVTNTNLIYNYRYGLSTNGNISNVLIDHVNASYNAGVMTGTTSYGRGMMFTASNTTKTNITITNSNFERNALTGLDFNIGISCSNLVISDNVFYQNGDSGLSILNGNGDIQVEGNEFSGNGRFGLEAKNPVGGGSFIVADNSFSGWFSLAQDPNRATDHAGLAIIQRDQALTTPPRPIPSGVVVRNNEFFGFTSAGTGDGFGLVVEGNNHLIESNYFSANDVGIQLQAANPDNADTPANSSSAWFNRGSGATAQSVNAQCNIITNNGIGVRNVTLDPLPASNPFSGSVAENNWFGCNAGPGNAGCDSVVGIPTPGADVDADPWLVLTATANPTTVEAGGTATINYYINTNSNGGAASCSLHGTIFSPIEGTNVDVDNPEASLVDGVGSVGITAGTSDGSVSITVDGQTIIIPVLILGGSSNPSAVLPKTGFAPGITTPLSIMPKDFYADMGSLWIEIPRLGVKERIVGVSIKNSVWDVTWLGNSIGWLESTAYPTFSGNTALTAHSYLASGLPGPFRYLASLKHGDQIIIHAYGYKYVYEVRSVDYVKPENMKIIDSKAQDWITLLTCHTYDAKPDAFLYRVAVKAVRISSSAE